MAKTLEYSRQKWERKTAGAGEKWKTNVSSAAGKFAAGVTAVAGACGPQMRGSWEQGVGAVSAAEFNAAISGKGQKWADNYRAGCSK